MTQDTLYRIREIVAANLGRDVREVVANTEIRDGLDSLEVLELAFEFEDEFGVLLEDGDIEEIKTVADAVKVVEKRLAKK